MIAENITEERAERDIAESLLRRVDTGVKSTSGISLFHILTFAAIVGSVALFLRGNKLGAIFVGLWPATFQALKSASQKK
jgi:hypothetical protein